MPNWFREFCKWCPSLRVVILQGDRANRAEVLNNQIRKRRFHVCITSYEIILRERSALSAIDWQYMIIDEAHRIKNEASALSTAVRQFSTKYRLLITGTPLQNNLHELWALLNFLMPDVFQSADLFDSYFKQTMETLKELPARVFGTQIHLDSNIEWAQDNSKPVGKYKRSSRSSKEYSELTKEVIEVCR